MTEAPASPDAAPAEPVAAPAPDFSWAGEQFIGEDGFKVDDFKAHYEELLTKQAQEAERPAPPEDYDLAIPEDIDFGEIQVPEGFTKEIDLQDEAFQPALTDFKEMLKQHGLPQEAASGFMGVLAKYEAGQRAKLAKVREADIQKLGQNKAQIDARLATAKRALEGRVAEEDAAAIMSNITSFEAFRALEKLLAPKGGGAPTPTPQAAQIDPLAARYPNSKRS